MERFHKIILGVAFICFIITFLIFILYYKNDTKLYPPALNACPDYWKVHKDGSCIIPTNGMNIGNLKGKGLNVCEKNPKKLTTQVNNTIDSIFITDNTSFLEFLAKNKRVYIDSSKLWSWIPIVDPSNINTNDYVLNKDVKIQTEDGKIQLLNFLIQNGRISDVDSDGNYFWVNPTNLSEVNKEELDRFLESPQNEKYIDYLIESQRIRKLITDPSKPTEYTWEWIVNPTLSTAIDPFYVANNMPYLDFLKQNYRIRQKENNEWEWFYPSAKTLVDTIHLQDPNSALFLKDNNYIQLNNTGKWEWVSLPVEIVNSNFVLDTNNKIYVNKLIQDGRIQQIKDGEYEWVIKNVNVGDSLDLEYTTMRCEDKDPLLDGDGNEVLAYTKLDIPYGYDILSPNKNRIYFHTNDWSTSGSSRCAHRAWAKRNNIVWDGVTNFNLCGE